MSSIFIFFLLFTVGSTGLILKLKKKISDTTLHGLIAVGAGAMIGVGLMHIFPEAISQLPTLAAPLFVAGFALIYIIENAFMIHTCTEHECHFHHVSLLSWIAIFIHTFFDGVAIAAAFSAQNTVGYMVLAGVVIHQIPVSLSLASLLRQSRYSGRGQTFFMLGFALSAPIGFLLSRFVFSSMTENLIAGILAFSGGTLLYLGASDLLPNVHKKTNNHILIASIFVMTLLLVGLAKLFE